MPNDPAAEADDRVLADVARPALRKNAAWRAASTSVRRRAPGAWSTAVRGWGAARRALEPVEIGRDTAVAAWTARRHRAELDEVDHVLHFAGFARSGHSVIASLLNAHPDMVVAHRARLMRYANAGVRGRPLRAMPLVADRRFEARGRVGSKRYDYTVPGQWQGRYRRLAVVGDSDSASGTLIVRPGAFATLLDRIDRPVKVISVVRNPFDNIATLSRRNRMTIDEAAAEYFDRARTIVGMTDLVPAARWLEIRQEDVIADPHGSLRAMCSFLGVDAPDDYLDACAGVLFRRPNRSRTTVEWPAGTIASIEERAAAVPFLEGYRFADQ